MLSTGFWIVFFSIAGGAVSWGTYGRIFIFLVEVLQLDEEWLTELTMHGRVGLPKGRLSDHTPGIFTVEQNMERAMLGSWMVG